MRVAGVVQVVARTAVSRARGSARFDGLAVVDEGFECRAEAGSYKQDGTESENVPHGVWLWDIGQRSVGWGWGWGY